MAEIWHVVIMALKLLAVAVTAVTLERILKLEGMRGLGIALPPTQATRFAAIKTSKVKIPIENQEGVQPLPAPLTRGDGSVVCDLTSVL